MINCPRMEKMYVSLKALLVNPQGKILILRLDNGKEDLPGGRMDAGEGIHDGLRRELREETGLDLDVTGVQPFFAGRRMYHGIEVERDGTRDEYVLCLYFVVPVGAVEIVLSNEHVSYDWIDPRGGKIESEHIAEVVDAYRRSEGIVVAADKSIVGRQGLGLIQLFTGNGKGKTTAAIGEAVRAAGAGKKVGIVFFDKGGDAHYSERAMLDRVGIAYVATGRDRIDPVTNRFDFSIQQIDRDEAARGLEEVRRMFAEGCDLVVLDEINSTTDLKMISVESVLSVLDEKPDGTEVVLTGRNAPDAFVDRAHLVTEMRLRKHYFYSGVKAREGIDY